MASCDFIIFGGTGQQGKICARDLLESGHKIMLAGRDIQRIRDLLKNRRAGFIHLDLRDEKAILNAIKKSGAKIVVNCAELLYNVPIMKACLHSNRPCTDLGGLQKITKQQFTLDNDFKKAGILCITGCGSTPGIANVMAAYAVNQFDSVDTITLGFAWDSNLKVFVVPYSMQSIFEEFTEKPVVFQDGKFKSSDRMICRGVFDFKEIGKQIVYCIVHSEVYTFPRYFKYKGLQNIQYLAGFPEHSMRVIQMLMGLGFNEKNKIIAEGMQIQPLDFTLEVLKKITVPSGYREVENIWVQITGIKEGKVHTSEMNCIVHSVKGWEEAGSNIDTGRTISIISQILFNGSIAEKGVYAPEGCVPQKLFFQELAKRKMWVYQDGKRIN